MKEWKLKALTPIWTGNIKRKSEKLIPTGIMGSLRWWFEVLVRGLGGSACDPSAKENRCPDELGRRCIVCELFGCTGWARKFRLMIVNANGEVIQEQIQANQDFILRFIPLRSIREEEWCLLDLTLRLIAECGAIGGKTVFKPSDDSKRENAFHHRDFGLIEYVSGPDGWRCTKTLDNLKAYVTDFSRWRKAPHSYTDSEGQHDYSWASLTNFWCVQGRYLARESEDVSTFNRVIGRPEPKSLAADQNYDSWLAGRRPDRNRKQDPESKKVFSFKTRPNTFGFVEKPTDEAFEQIFSLLREIKDTKPEKDFSNATFVRGIQILEKLLTEAHS